jgi:glycosyltransferase involved in cell wall biosynthesis
MTPPARRHGILVLENHFEMGGSEKKLFDFMERIDASRFALKVCCLKEGGHFKPALERMGIPFYERLLRHRFDALAYRRLARVIRAEDIRLVYTFGHPNTVLFSSFARRTGRVERLVISYHAMGGTRRGRLAPPWLRPFILRADALLAVSETHRRYLSEVERLPASRIEVIHNGVDLERYRPATPDERAAARRALGMPERDVVFAAVASLKPIKRIDLLLEAIAPVMRARDDVRLVIAGEGPDRGALERRAAALGVDARVSFLGVRDDVAAVLRASDAAVLSSRMEAFPNAVLEAMAAGLPLVSTDVGSVREMVVPDESALLVPPEEAEMLRAAIERLATDAGTRERLGRRGRAIVEERFGLERMCAAREALFSRLLDARGAA